MENVCKGVFNLDKQSKDEFRREIENEEFQNMHLQAQQVMLRYMQKLNSIYKIKTGYGFIRHLENRTKTVDSIEAKLKRKSYPVTFENATTKLNDISGVRVICYTMKEIYWIARQFDGDDVPKLENGKKIFQVVKVKDFIRKPKKSGYESYHLIIDVDAGLKPVRMELQLRTIGMDAWASLDTMIRYKNQGGFPVEFAECMAKYTKVNKQFDKLIQKMKNRKG